MITDNRRLIFALNNSVYLYKVMVAVVVIETVETVCNIYITTLYMHNELHNQLGIIF